MNEQIKLPLSSRNLTIRLPTYIHAYMKYVSWEKSSVWAELSVEAAERRRDLSQVYIFEQIKVQN